MEQEIEYVVLENSIPYIVIGNKIINDIKYYILVNSKNSNDFVIRKLIYDELVGLDDEQEFDLVINNIGDLNGN